MSVLERFLDRKNFRNIYVENNLPLKITHRLTAQEGRPKTGITVLLDKES